MTEFIRYQDSPIVDNEPICALFYGAAGSGKTECAGSSGDRTLYIDVGRSASTFKGVGFQTRKGKFNGIYVPVGEDIEKTFVPKIAKAYDRVCDVIDEALAKIPDDFDTIVVDEMTRFRSFAMNKGIEVNASEERSKTKDKSARHDIIIPGVQDFQAEMSLVKQFCEGYFDICKIKGKHLIVIAHERFTYRKADKIGGEATLLKISPGFTGQTFPDDVVNIFDLVWHFEVMNGTVFRANTIGNNLIRCKTRYGGIFNEYEMNVNWLDVVRRVREGIAAASKTKK